jgi:hypothetical protein
VVPEQRIHLGVHRHHVSAASERGQHHARPVLHRAGRLDDDVDARDLGENARHRA